MHVVAVAAFGWIGSLLVIDGVRLRRELLGSRLGICLMPYARDDRGTLVDYGYQSWWERRRRVA